MRERHSADLAPLTTLRLGGPADRLVEVETEAEFVDVVSACDSTGEPVLVLGGGSNLVIADSGFAGTVVAVRTRGVVTEGDLRVGETVTVAAGENWDDVVARAVDAGRPGIEALSGIPGTTGAVPIQNVGAYGQEVSQTVASVRAWDRRARHAVTLDTADCGFGYRSSRFKNDPDAYLVLDVTFLLHHGEISTPIRYPELARGLGVALGDRAPLRRVREAVLALRRRKGMVLDTADHDTWSAGSFFTNPVLAPPAAASLPADAPRWPQPDGRVKTSAAWLIERAGFEKGYGCGPVGISAKHPLALTNRGGARTTELLSLAREIRTGVRERFGVELANEPVTVGCSL
ncbi:MAG: UDP-N-acetylmuramate dehydrogenase [Nocardioidaceae bacterium]